MLTSTVVRLRAKNGGRLPLAMGEYGHAAFMGFIRQVASDLAQTLHDAGTRQPFTVSPLLGQIRRQGREWQVRPGAGCWMRFTILDPAIYTIFSRYFAEVTSFNTTLSLGPVNFAVEEITTAHEPNGWSSYTTFEILLSQASDAPVIPLRFHSLTAFNLGDAEGVGARVTILPTPRLVFESLLARWNLFSQQLLDTTSLLALLRDGHVLVKRYQLRSDMWQFRRHPQVGFLGHCVYEAKGVDAQLVRQLNALADFAFYAGVGYHTTMGMGQTRRMPGR